MRGRYWLNHYILHEYVVLEAECVRVVLFCVWVNAFSDIFLLFFSWNEVIRLNEIDRVAEPFSEAVDTAPATRILNQQAIEQQITVIRTMNVCVFGETLVTGA